MNSIFGPDSCDKNYESNEDLAGYAKKTYVDVEVRGCLMKSGGRMTGSLNMRDNLITGLPTIYSHIYNGNEAISWRQSVTLVNDALRKHPTTEQMDAIIQNVDIIAFEVNQDR